MDREEVTKWLSIIKANLNSFPEVSNAKKIEALAEAIRLLKNEQSADKIDCDHMECRNCINHKYCDYESSGSEIPNKSEIQTSSDCVDRHSVDLLAYRYLKEPTDNHMAFYEDFLDLPSVTPIRPKGHWIVNKEKDTICCSCCNDKQKIGKDEIELFDTAFTGFRFCRYCGSDNREVEE